MIVLLERPHFSQKVALLARQGGEYVRPVVGSFIDMRVEDILPHAMMKSKYASNLVARLPDVHEAGQYQKYLVCTANYVDRVDATEEEALELTKSGMYLMLPDSTSSPLWEYSQAPWWEFAAVFDEYGNFVKAPKTPRANEPTADDIDERLDEFEENMGKLTVVSPLTLDKWAMVGVREDYIKRLNRIFG